MAKDQARQARISDYVPAEKLAIPVYNTDKMLNQEIYISTWEFKVSEKGGDYVTFEGIFATSQLPFSCSSFDRAIVAQLAAYPADAPRPIAAKVT